MVAEAVAAARPHRHHALSLAHGDEEQEKGVQPQGSEVDDSCQLHLLF